MKMTKKSYDNQFGSTEVNFKNLEIFDLTNYPFTGTKSNIKTSYRLFGRKNSFPKDIPTFMSIKKIDIPYHAIRSDAHKLSSKLHVLINHP